MSRSSSTATRAALRPDPPSLSTAAGALACELVLKLTVSLPLSPPARATSPVSVSSITKK